MSFDHNALGVRRDSQLRKGNCMRAVLFESFGDPVDVVHLGEAQVTEPAAGELRVKLLKSPIHNHDLAIIRGVYGYKPTLPAIPGSEALGVVDALGSGVKGFTVGQKVAVPAGARMWAEYFNAPANSALPVPPTIPDDIACQLLAMPLNSYLLFEELNTKPGDWIIQTASNGAVGRVIVQLAKARKVNVISLIRRDDGIAEMEALGAEHVLSTEGDGWEARVPEITGGAPVKGAIDSVSGPLASPLASVLAPGGLFISFGAMSQKPIVLDPNKLIFGGIIVRGFWGAKWVQEASSADKLRVIGEVVRLVQDGTIKLGVEAEYDLADIKEAVVRSDQSGRAGKVLLTAAA
jgi:NADPH:quinone reductase-like Zn-dependent oxidoreductase